MIGLPFFTDYVPICFQNVLCFVIFLDWLEVIDDELLPIFRDLDDGPAVRVLLNVVIQSVIILVALNRLALHLALYFLQLCL